MTREDTAKVIAIITAAYPGADKLRGDRESITAMVGIWADVFADDDSRLVAAAVKRHIALSKWPPAIADVREAMVDIARPDIVPASQAWELARRFLQDNDYLIRGKQSDAYWGAMRRHLHEEGPEPVPENLSEKLHATLQPCICAALESVGLEEILDLDAEKARRAFDQAYREITQAERERLMLPARWQKEARELGSGTTQRRLRA